VSDIIEFLTARLDQEAEAWSGGTGLITQPNFASLSRYALADIAAKRAIVARHEGAVRSLAAIEAVDGFNLNAHAVVRAVHDSTLGAVHHLASVYSDHPDYREGWKP